MQSHQEAHLKWTARLDYLSQPKGENIGELTGPWTRAHSPHSESQHSLIPAQAALRGTSGSHDKSGPFSYHKRTCRLGYP